MKLFLILLSAFAIAEDSKAPPPAQAAPSTIVYELRDLRPSGFSQFVGAGEVVRQYFELQNEQGSHHVVYEETPAAAPARTVIPLRQISTAFDSSCSMDIECTSKAFCTGDCRHMYYEVANAPGDSLAPDRDKCKILFLSCEKVSRAPLPPPPPVPPPQDGAHE